MALKVEYMGRFVSVGVERVDVERVEVIVCVFVCRERTVNFGHFTGHMGSMFKAYIDCQLYTTMILMSRFVPLSLWNKIVVTVNSGKSGRKNVR